MLSLLIYPKSTIFIRIFDVACISALQCIPGLMSICEHERLKGTQYRLTKFERWLDSLRGSIFKEPTFCISLKDWPLAGVKDFDERL